MTREPFRGTDAFLRGKRDAEANRVFEPRAAAGTFGLYDYEQGYGAGFNNLYWDAVRENERRDRCRP
jgi:hypothetical protein